MTASAITHAVPDMKAKFYAATQTIDEARTRITAVGDTVAEAVADTTPLIASTMAVSADVAIVITGGGDDGDGRPPSSHVTPERDAPRRAAIRVNRGTQA